MYLTDVKKKNSLRNFIYICSWEWQFLNLKRIEGSQIILSDYLHSNFIVVRLENSELVIINRET